MQEAEARQPAAERGQVQIQVESQVELEQCQVQTQTQTQIGQGRADQLEAEQVREVEAHQPVAD